MNIPFYIIFLPIVAALIITAIATPLSLRWIKKAGLVDDPQKHKHPAIIHKRIVPRGGGLPLFIGTWFTIPFFLPITPQIIAIFTACTLLLIVGLIDDKQNSRAKDFSPYSRFIVTVLSAIIVVASGISIQFITNPFGEGVLALNTILIPFFFFALPLSDIFSVLWLIWIMNMINWSKGVDGQMPGIVAISAIVIGLLSLRINGGIPLALDATISFIIAGSAIGFLFYNFYPAKIFPGWSATSLYLLLGVVSILSSAKLATAILVMGVPAVDALFTIIRRLLNKRSPFQGDRKHLHHLLLSLGYGQRKIALFYWLLSAILGILALQLENKSKFFAIIMVVVVTVGALLFLHAVTKHKDEKKAS
ncbi:MAG: MraY family glycosyltransferase [Patescibacteria group bacterium]